MWYKEAAFGVINMGETTNDLTFGECWPWVWPFTAWLGHDILLVPSGQEEPEVGDRPSPQDSTQYWFPIHAKYMWGNCIQMSEWNPKRYFGKVNETIWHSNLHTVSKFVLTFQLKSTLNIWHIIYIIIKLWLSTSLKLVLYFWNWRW